MESDTEEEKTGRWTACAATYRAREEEEEEEEERRRKEEKRKKKTVWELARHGSWLAGKETEREGGGAPGGICRSVGAEEEGEGVTDNGGRVDNHLGLARARSGKRGGGALWRPCRGGKITPRGGGRQSESRVAAGGLATLL